MNRKDKIKKENLELIDDFIRLRKIQKRAQKTLECDEDCLYKFASFIGDIDFKDADERTLQDFFNTIDTYNTYNLLGVKINLFYRWLFKLPKRTRAKNMQWFEFISEHTKKRHESPDKIKNQFITEDEYQTILENCWDKFGMWEAMFETYYLSGGRFNEVRNMNIGDVRIDETKSHVSIILRESKTQPREVPLPSTPDLLIRWLEHHPDKENPDAPLWISLGTINKGERIGENAVYSTFWKIRNKTDIKNTLTIHCFRKTRATIMFNERATDGGLIYSDSHLARFFGWELSTVAKRRQEYDLSTFEDLQKIIFKTTDKKIESLDIVKQQKRRLESEFEQRFKEMEDEFNEKMRILDSGLANAAKKHNPSYPSEKIIEDYNRLRDGLTKILMKMISENRPHEEIAEFRKFLEEGLT